MKPIIRRMLLETQVMKLEGSGPWTLAKDQSIEKGADGPRIENLSGGIYVVRVTDESGCEAIGSVELPDSPELEFRLVGANENCNNADGTIEVQLSKSVENLKYSWSNGESSTSIEGLKAGTYRLTLEDGNGCVYFDSISIANISGPTLQVIKVADAACGLNNGIGRAVVTGGTPPYTYQWGNGVNTPEVDSLGPGTYPLTVTDNNNCIVVGRLTINGGPELQITIRKESDETCNEPNGAAQAIALGGTPPFRFLWSNGNTSDKIEAVRAGTYSVTVVDSLNCSASASVTIDSFPGPSLTITNQTDATCRAANGSATVEGRGGTGTLSYSWETGSTAPSITGLAAGTYGVTVTDENGCIASLEVTINDVGGPSLSLASQTDATCGSANGSAMVVGSGGSGELSYSWETGETTATVTGLVAGNYGVTVTDENDCIASLEVTINDVGGPSLSLASQTDATCGNANGSATVVGSGGSGELSYSWETGETTATVTGLVAGNYGVTVTDENDCIASLEVTINDVGGPSLSLASQTDATCGNANGSATVVGSGGSGELSYSWETGETTATVTGLVAGDYGVTVTDGNDCSASLEVTINDQGGPSLTIASQTDATCGSANGSATVVGGGGSGELSYSWETGATTATVTGLGAGTYGVTVTDANDCIASLEVTINDQGGPSLTITSQTDATCGVANGSATVIGSGGTGELSYSWETGATTASVTGLGAGTYGVTVTDGNDCSASLEVTINDQGGPSLTITSQTDATCGNANGSATVIGSGGTGELSYSWETGATTASVTGLVPGTYGVTVTDSSGCTSSTTVSILDQEGPSLSIEEKVETSCGLANGRIVVSATGATERNVFSWSTGASTQPFLIFRQEVMV